MSKRYILDAEKSRFSVQAFAAGALSGFAHNPKFAIRQLAEELRFAPDDPGESRFNMSVKAFSLNLMDNVKATDRAEIQRQLMDEVLEVGRFPEISFMSEQIVATKIADGWFGAEIRGEMRLHGVIRQLAIDSQLRTADRDVQLSGEFSVLLADYKLKRVTGVGGLIKLKEELKFQFDLVGHGPE